MTRIRQVIRYMKELESGFDRTLLPLPTETVFLKPAGSLSGRYLPFEADPHDEEDYSGIVSIPWLWQPTEEATPSRWYPARTKGHSRGTIINPKTRKAISYSSTYEMNLAYMLCASRHIALVEDQPSAVPVPTEDGEKMHTIDYRTTMITSRNRIVVAVRPSWLLEKDGLPETIASINLGSLEGFADEAIILTEKEITDARGWNGKSVLRALNSAVADDNERLRDFASKFQGTVSLMTLTAGFEETAAATNAVWCLIHDEVLVPVRPDLRLVDAPFVRFNHNH
ncbi:hypothetical protein [Rhizobium binxianense]|uniref:hypothetical protein n=1 Tax=Rhizobium binxianense TaxID=3024242 RepID=UPI00235F39E5|nr:hypothetical protein [Rhizobium sp. MJ37]MDC9835710.1 hypothetical protein [Rhizobium sp. MJ37]